MTALCLAAVWLTAATHFAFLAYLVGGGFLAFALRRAHRAVGSRRALLAHIAVVGWAVGSVMFRLWCPLTTLEQWLRARAGMPPLPPSGFIDHYLTGVLYPESATGAVQAGVFGAVAISWIACAVAARTAPPARHPNPVS